MWNPAPLGKDSLARRSASDDAVTWLVAAVVYAGFGLLTWHWTALPWWLVAPLAATLFTCVGVPTYRNTAGGKPGAPARTGRSEGRATCSAI